MAALEEGGKEETSLPFHEKTEEKQRQNGLSKELFSLNSLAPRIRAFFPNSG